MLPVYAQQVCQADITQGLEMMSPCWHFLSHDIFSPKHPSEFCLLLPSFIVFLLFLLYVYSCLFLSFCFPSSYSRFLSNLIISSFSSSRFLHTQVRSILQFPLYPTFAVHSNHVWNLCDPDCLLLSPPLSLINHLSAAFSPMFADCYQAMSSFTRTPLGLLPWLILHLLKHNDTFISCGTQPTF